MSIIPEPVYALVRPNDLILFDATRTTEAFLAVLKYFEDDRILAVEGYNMSYEDKQKAYELLLKKIEEI